MVGVDGELGSSTQRALTWKSHGGFAFLLDTLHDTSVFFVSWITNSRHFGIHS